MAVLQNKIDFELLVSVKMANPNGDPLDGNRPRIDYERYGEISDVCIKRKIRNRMQDLGYKIFVQTDERKDDGCTSLSKRAETLGQQSSKDEYAKKACETWLDVRSFGQIFTFKAKKSKKNKKIEQNEQNESSDDKNGPIGVRGPVSIHQAVSVDPIEIHSLQITKSVNGEESETKGKDTMGMKHMVRFGLYVIKGSINVQLAQKTGFTVEDAEILKKCLLSLFENDASSARPDGSMEVCRLYWWQHNCKDGQYSSAQVHRSVKIAKKADIDIPNGFEDYEVDVEELNGLTSEILAGR